MKYVLVLLVVIVVAWVMLGRGRGRGGKPGPAGDAKRQEKPAADKRPAAGGAAQAMVACVHCGLHLPRAEAVADAQGKLFCDDAHRLAGPR